MTKITSTATRAFKNITTLSPTTVASANGVKQKRGSVFTAKRGKIRGTDC